MGVIPEDNKLPLDVREVGGAVRAQFSVPAANGRAVDRQIISGCAAKFAMGTCAERDGGDESVHMMHENDSGLEFGAIRAICVSWGMGIATR